MRITGDILVGNEECQSSLGHILAHIENLKTYLGPTRYMRDELSAPLMAAVARVEKMTLHGKIVAPLYETDISRYAMMFPQEAASIDDNLRTWEQAFQYLLRDSAITYAFRSATSDGDTASDYAMATIDLFTIHCEYTSGKAFKQGKELGELPFSQHTS